MPGHRSDSCNSTDAVKSPALMQRTSNDLVMRVALCSLILALACVTAQAAEPSVAIYDADPEHLWNRLYRAIAVRTEAGVEFGADNAVPFNEDFDDADNVITVLDEFLSSRGEARSPSDLRRALLLHDVWAAFDLAAGGEHKVLQRRLASVIGRLAMKDHAIAGLQDNYAEAVESGKFARDFDPARPGRAFLPLDLLDSDGPWVQIGESGLPLVAPVHVGTVSGRSAFMVFIRCPGGRKATLSYLETLNLHRTPWVVQPAEIGTTHPGNRKVRWDPLRVDPATPQFPEGTVVALVRRMAVINDSIEPVLTPITQTVQFRVFTRIAAGRQAYPFADSQLAFEVVMRRRELLAARAGGLQPVAPDEKEYQRIVQFHDSRAERLRGRVVLSTCRICHDSNGIFSIRTYLGGVGAGHRAGNPQLLPADRSDYQGRATVAWKKQQFDWGLLRGLLQRED